MKYRKRPVEIEAVKWTGDNLEEVIDLIGLHPRFADWFESWRVYEERVAAEGLKIFTRNGPVMAEVGEMIVRGVEGEAYPCAESIFEATYFSSPKVPDGAALVVTIAEDEMEAEVCAPDDYVIVKGPELEMDAQVWSNGTAQLTLKKRRSKAPQ